MFWFRLYTIIFFTAKWESANIILIPIKTIIALILKFISLTQLMWTILVNTFWHKWVLSDIVFQHHGQRHKHCIYNQCLRLYPFNVHNKISMQTSSAWKGSITHFFVVVSQRKPSHDQLNRNWTVITLCCFTAHSKIHS